MTPEKLFHELLGLGLNWEVLERRFAPASGTVHWELRGPPRLWDLVRCPKDTGRVFCYDHTEELTWRHLNVFQHRCEIGCRLPRAEWQPGRLRSPMPRAGGLQPPPVGNAAGGAAISNRRHEGAGSPAACVQRLRAFSLRGARGEGGRRPDEGCGHQRQRAKPLTSALSPCSAKGEGEDLWPSRASAKRDRFVCKNVSGFSPMACRTTAGATALTIPLLREVTLGLRKGGQILTSTPMRTTLVVAQLCVAVLLLPRAHAQQTETLRKQFLELLAAAVKGDATAQSNLAHCYHEGQGVGRNYTEAVKWYQKAADQNDAFAQNNLGFAYANGQGVETNYSEAMKWYRRAALQNDAEAQFNLGYAHYSGQGVERNYQEAVKWYRKAAEQNNAGGQNNLGNCFSRGHGVERNHEEAVKWYRKAAEQNHARAQISLGACYKVGEGVEKNEIEAVRWFRKAAVQNEAGGQYNLGACFVDGVGVPKDMVEAVKWLHKAADQNHGLAQFYLGLFYTGGQGVAKNEAEGVRWFRKAAEQNVVSAQYSLGFAYVTGNGVSKDDAEATKWYRKAAEQNDAGAQSDLALMYFNGAGVPKDYVEAYAWSSLAAVTNEKAAANRALVAERLTPDEIFAGVKRAKELRAQIEAKLQSGCK